MGTDEIEVRRSRRRRRTVSAYREGGRTIVLIPARFSVDEERTWVDAMLRKLAAGDKRRRPSDQQLLERATDLSRRYLGGRSALYRCHGQIGSDPSVHVATGRNGRPDSGLCFDSRGDNGHGRYLHGRSL